DVFIPDAERHEAYDDHPVPIGFGQTISQPYIVAFMTASLRVEPSHRVLEVYSIEVIGELAARARDTLSSLGYSNVHIRTGDGHLGWAAHAPYDRILVAAAAESVPPALVEQLADTGILVIPVGVWHQELRVLRRHGERLDLLATLPVRFVPLVKG